MSCVKKPYNYEFGPKDCRGWEYVLEETNSKVKANFSECILLYDEDDEYINVVKGDGKNYPVVYSLGVPYERIKDNVYRKLKAPEFDTSVDEII